MASVSKNLKIVLSGGPGSGKTSVLDLLKKMGYQCFEEQSRKVIQQAKDKGIENMFLTDPTSFSEALYQERKTDFERAQKAVVIPKKPYVFFDRGIHDIYAYLDALGKGETYWKDRVMRFRYDLILLFPPWEAIYKKDAQRMESFDEAVRYFTFLEKIYEETGAPIVKIPKAPVTARATFIESQLYKND